MQNGPSQFTPASGSVSLAAGQCVTVPFTVTKPSVLPAYNSACFELTVSENGSALCTSTGSVWGVPGLDRLCIDRGGPLLNTGLLDTLRFVVTNPTATPDTFQFTADITPADMAGPNTMVGLNGLPPGVPATGAEIVAGMSSVVIPFIARFAAYEPLRFYDAVLSRDYGPTGPVIPIASAVVRAPLPAAVMLTDCNGNGVADSTDIANGTSQDANHNGIPDECEPGVCTTGVGGSDAVLGLRFLGAEQNPSRGVARLRFAGRGCVQGSVSLVDVSGRLIRHLALPTGGSGTVVWDGRDQAGNPARPGMYFVRAHGSCGSALGSVVLIQ
jgi:hypothetical protein